MGDADRTPLRFAQVFLQFLLDPLLASLCFCPYSWDGTSSPVAQGAPRGFHPVGGL